MSPQCAAVLRYIETHGSITSQDAFRVLNCTRLAARISDLQEKYGYAITSEMETDGRSHYARYRLQTTPVQMVAFG